MFTSIPVQFITSIYLRFRPHSDLNNIHSLHDFVLLPFWYNYMRATISQKHNHGLSMEYALLIILDVIQVFTLDFWDYLDCAEKLRSYEVLFLKLLSKSYQADFRTIFASHQHKGHVTWCFLGVWSINSYMIMMTGLWFVNLF